MVVTHGHGLVGRQQDNYLRQERGGRPSRNFPEWGQEGVPAHMHAVEYGGCRVILRRVTWRRLGRSV